MRLPFSAMLPPVSSDPISLAAAYPATDPTAIRNYPYPGATTTDENYNFAPSFRANSVWGEDVNNNNLLDTGEDLNGNGVLDREQFPDITPDGAPFISGGTAATENGQTPMLPSMTKAMPQRVARSLWYRTVDANSNPTGNSNNVRYDNPDDLFIYNTSYNTSTVNANGQFNTNQPAPLILPATVCINPTSGTVDKTCTDPTVGLLNLNSPANPIFPSGSAANQPASSFTVCGVTGASRRYQAVERVGATFLTDITGGACPITLGNPRSAIVTFATGLNAIATAAPATATTAQTVTLGGTGTTRTVNALSSTKLNVLDLTAANINTDLKDATLTLSANGNPDPTFLLRAPNADVTIDGLYVKLNGVDPNKVFWVFPRVGLKALTIQGGSNTPSKPTVLVGNFIGNMPTTGGTATNSTGLNIGSTGAGKGVSIRSARFLGFRALTVQTAATESTAATITPVAIGVDSTAKITAMTTVDQPVVVPVLQIHAPVTTITAASASALTLPQPTAASEKYSCGMNGNPATAICTDSANVPAQWTQRVAAATTTVNVYFVAGNTPSRSYVPYDTSPSAGNVGAPNSIYTGETGGGLQNFIRFSENWTGTTLKIAGGFIQNTRSTFATAPFSNTAPYTTLDLAGCGTATFLTRATCIDTSSDTQSWFTNPNAVTEPLSNFAKYYQSVTAQSIPFYTAPTRLWGFDVGLLVQQPDLFAQRFSQALPNPNEFFRESSKEDPWITTMLCALQPSPATLNSANVTADGINVGLTRRIGTKVTNYTSFALGQKDRPTSCNTVNPTTTYLPVS
jgi:hypothetical protein